MVKKNNSSNGFTLIEVLIYLALFTLIMVGALSGVYQIIASTDKTSSKIFVEQDGNFILRKIDWALTGASNIDFSIPNAIKITRSDLPVNPLLFDMDVFGHIQLTRGGSGATAIALSSDEVTITNLQFIHLTSPEGVRAIFTVNSIDNIVSQNFETTKYLH